MENTPNMKERDSLLEQISAYEFVLEDLKLYLDTHPCCQEVLTLYRNYVKQAQALREQYVSFYGPLMANNFEPDNFWCWINDPWPWHHD